MSKPRTNFPPGIKIETFDLRLHRAKPGAYDFLFDLPNGAHVHFSDVNDGFRRTIFNLNKRQQKKVPGFYLSVHMVSDSDPKGAGFRVLRRDYEVKP